MTVLRQQAADRQVVTVLQIDIATQRLYRRQLRQVDQQGSGLATDAKPRLDLDNACVRTSEVDLAVAVAAYEATSLEQELGGGGTGIFQQPQMHVADSGQRQRAAGTETAVVSHVQAAPQQGQIAICLRTAGQDRIRQRIDQQIAARLGLRDGDVTLGIKLHVGT